MDPTSKNRIISRMSREISLLSPKQKRAAKYILDNQGDFGLDPIRKTAEKANVSTYTLINLATALGFSSYEELREPFRHALVAENATAQHLPWIENLASSSPIGQIHANAARNSTSVVQNTLSRTSTEKLEAAVDILFASRQVYVMGMRACYSLAHYFNYVARMALSGLRLIPQPMSSAQDELSTAARSDTLLALTFTPYSIETIQACHYAKERGLSLILFSDTIVVDPELRPDITFVVSTMSTHHFSCYSGAMALLESLIALIVHRGGKEAADRIDDYQQVRRRFNAYWSSAGKKNKSFR